MQRLSGDFTSYIWICGKLMVKKVWKASWNNFGLSLPTWDTGHNYLIIMLQSFAILGRTDTVTAAAVILENHSNKEGTCFKTLSKLTVPKAGGIAHHWRDTSPEFPPSSGQMPLKSHCMGKFAIVLEHVSSANNQQTAVLLIWDFYDNNIIFKENSIFMADKCYLIIFLKLNLSSYCMLSKLLYKITLKAKII